MRDNNINDVINEEKIDCVTENCDFRNAWHGMHNFIQVVSLLQVRQLGLPLGYYLSYLS
jgi:hypothetical protein